MRNAVALECAIGEVNRESYYVCLLGTHSLQRLILLGEIYASDKTYCNQRRNYTYDTDRICYSVTQSYCLVVNARSVGISLLRGSKSGSVCHSTRQNAHHSSHRRACHNVYNICGYNAQRNHRCGASDHLQTALLE